MTKTFKVFNLAMILMAALLYLTPTSVQAGDYKPVTGTELQEMMSDGGDLKIIDVRDANSFNSGHIEGAMNIPYKVAEGRLMKELQTTERIVFVCYGGPTGDGFAEVLVSNNYTDVYSLRGGMNNWQGRVVR
jgi:thiosulfate sulfurtransferase